MHETVSRGLHLDAGANRDTLECQLLERYVDFESVVALHTKRGVSVGMQEHED